MAGATRYGGGMKQRNALVFLSGRLIALVVLLTFQMLAVRLLPATEYGRYALVFAWALLLQTVISFGIPRLIPKYVSQAGWRLAPAVVRRLVIGIVGFRLVASALLMIPALAVAAALGWIGRGDAPLIVAGGGYILVSLVQVDADAMAQALSLQLVSRRCMIGEAIVRLALVAGGAVLLDWRTAVDVLAVSLLTSGIAAAVLLRAVLRALPTGASDAPAMPPLDRGEFRAVALGGYASTMAWFGSSPAVVRLIAGRLLDATAFAGFSFAQTLVLSFQRYTPGMLLFPFVEPNVMAHHARTGDSSRLETALSVVTKVDLVLIGAAAVGTAIAGRPLIQLMTGGRYGAEAHALPWLLAYVVMSSIYRAFEIVAVALGAAAALVRSLALSVAWLTAAIVLARLVGLEALLLYPVGDTLSRLALVHRALRRAGMRRAVDLAVAGQVVLVATGCGALGLAAARLVAPGPVGTVAIGSVAAIAYLAVMALLRPLRTAELALLLGDAPRTGMLGRLTALARA